MVRATVAREPEPTAAQLDTAARSTERATGVDTAWVRADAPENPMVITAALLFDELPAFETVERLLAERLVPEPRFRQRIAPAPLGLGVVRWEPDPSFALRDHVHRVALPAPADRAVLEPLLSDLASRALPAGRSPWVAYHAAGPDGAGALVVRVHHAVADGAALVRVLARLADHEPRAGEVSAEVDAGSMAARAGTAAGTSRAGAPGPFAAAASLGSLLFARSDTGTSLKRAISARKRVAFRAGISLAEMKSIARAAGCRLNDVLLAATAGALRETLLARGEPVSDCVAHAVVPVDYGPGAAGAGALGNHFGMLFAPLPVGEPDPLARARTVARATSVLKRGAQGPALLGLLAAVGHTSSAVERVLLDVFDRKATVVVTNVVGPPHTVHIAGRAVRSIIAWVPQAGHLGLGVSLVSYAGKVALGVLADARVLPDADAFAESLSREVGALSGRAGGAGGDVPREATALR